LPVFLCLLCLVCYILSLKEVPDEDTLGCAESLLSGRGEERTGAHGRSDPVALSGVPENDPQEDGRQVLVLSRLGQNESPACAPSLPEHEAGRDEDGSVGGKKPGGCPDIVSQSPVREAVCSFLGTVRSASLIYPPGTLRFNNRAKRFEGYFYSQKKLFLPHTCNLPLFCMSLAEENLCICSGVLRNFCFNSRVTPHHEVISRTHTTPIVVSKTLSRC